MKWIKAILVLISMHMLMIGFKPVQSELSFNSFDLLSVHSNHHEGPANSISVCIRFGTEDNEDETESESSHTETYTISKISLGSFIGSFGNTLQSEPESARIKLPAYIRYLRMLL